MDELLLAGGGDEPCLTLDESLDRAGLRELVGKQQGELAAAGVTGGSTVALRLPPSLAGISVLLATWRLGAQALLLDVRLAPAEVARALDRLAPQFLVEALEPVHGSLKGFHRVTPVVTARQGRPAVSDHVLLQLSSGSTGPSKVIGRTARSLAEEIERYTLIPGLPGPGERVVVLASTVHVLGLVGGVLHSLHRHAEIVIPARTTVDGILTAIAADPRPTTVIGAPVQAQILASVRQPPALPHFRGMITGGDAVPDQLWTDFTTAYPATLGTMYGMTETGVIATDILGAHRPHLAPAPGLGVRIQDGQILVATDESPYVGLTDPARWADGLLRTKDAGELDPGSGLLTVQGRLDSQVSVGGLKVDLLEVERTIAGLPGVQDAVVVFDEVIKAYLVLDGPDAAAGLDAALADALAPYKRPRLLRPLTALPRTATGKPVRDPRALHSAAAAGH
ncbi:class I adenylate-forming enzyme family protein [Kitasatospora kazusensis]|uniref:class I adenylate-forming enzyme family protein n=1 Tax=Kitasatospora kazusensis TaxID=407974 RepID=UPI0031D82494